MLTLEEPFWLMEPILGSVNFHFTIPCQSAIILEILQVALLFSK